VIETEEEQPQRGVAHALITTTLYDGEAGAFFAPGQRFTIWADALVGHTIRADGLVGYGAYVSAFHCLRRALTATELPEATQPVSPPCQPHLVHDQAVRRQKSRHRP
jgi:hypothetical protein